MSQWFLCHVGTTVYFFKHTWDLECKTVSVLGSQMVSFKVFELGI